MLCGSCHIRGAKDKIPASKGFIRHHEQYNKLLASLQKNLTCITYHNPHLDAQRGIGIKISCNTCQSKVAKAFDGSRHSRRRIKCESCHMAPAAENAAALGKSEGDIKSHSFTINIDPNAKMFTDDGKFAKGYLTVEYSCLYCHPSETKQWALQYAKGVHKLGKK